MITFGRNVDFLLDTVDKGKHCHTIDTFREYYITVAEKWSHCAQHSIMDHLRYNSDSFLVSRTDHQPEHKSRIASNVPDLSALVCSLHATA